MERLERQLSTNMALLAIIGAVMLGLGQQDAKLALLVFIGAVASVVYTDRRKKFSLNHHLANVAALCAVGLALFDYSASDRNQQLLAIANLLVYLQVVVFFQEKNARIFGQLAMLSLLQVVVAAALNYSILFGVLIVVYMAIGLPTLSLFFFYRELGRFVPRAAEETGASSPPGSHPTEAEPARPRGAKPRRRWPLAAREATFVGADFKPQEEAFGRGGCWPSPQHGLLHAAADADRVHLRPPLGTHPLASGHDRGDAHRRLLGGSVAGRTRQRGRKPGNGHARGVRR